MIKSFFEDLLIPYMLLFDPNFEITDWNVFPSL